MINIQWFYHKKQWIFNWEYNKKQGSIVIIEI